MALPGFSWTIFLLLCTLEQLGALAIHTEAGRPGLEQSGDSMLLAGGRVKRGWVWNQFFVVEEYTGTEPLYVGKLMNAAVRPGTMEMLRTSDAQEALLLHEDAGYSYS
ncbi:unnamed protein product [Natator depressus]